MKFQLHWLEQGQWCVREVRVAQTFEFHGLMFAIHRPPDEASRTWCVSELSSGATLTVNQPGTKADAQSAACKLLAQNPPERWQQTVKKILDARH